MCKTVSAEVKIEINQKLSLERQAFDALMRINNGLRTNATQNVGIGFKIKPATPLPRPRTRPTSARLPL